MDTREDHGIEVRQSPVAAPSARPHGLGHAPDGPAPTPPRRRLVVGLVGLLVLALVATLALVLVLGDDEPTVQATTPRADTPSVPDALGMTLQVRESVVC